MNEVIKYEEGDPCAGMYESPEGTWVHIDDYDQLKAECERLARINHAQVVVHNRHVIQSARDEEQILALRKQLDAAMELLESSKSLMTIDEWLERNKK